MEATSTAGSRRSSFSSSYAPSLASTGPGAQPSFHRRVPTGLSMTPMGHSQLPALSMTGLPSTFAETISRSPSATSLISLGRFAPQNSVSEPIVEGYDAPSEPPPGYVSVEKVQPTTRVEGRRRRFSTLSGGHISGSGRHTSFGPTASAAEARRQQTEEAPLGAEGNLNRRWSSVYAANPALKGQRRAADLPQRPLGRRWSNKLMDPTSSAGDITGSSAVESDEMDEISSVAVTESSVAPRGGPEPSSMRFSAMAKIAEGSVVSAVSAVNGSDAELPAPVRFSKHVESILQNLRKIGKDHSIAPKLKMISMTVRNIFRDIRGVFCNPVGSNVLLKMNLKALQRSLVAVLTPSGEIAAQDPSIQKILHLIFTNPSSLSQCFPSLWRDFWQRAAMDHRHKATALQVCDIFLQALLITAPLRSQVISAIIQALQGDSIVGLEMTSESTPLVANLVDCTRTLLQQGSGRSTDRLEDALILFLEKLDILLVTHSEHALQVLRMPPDFSHSVSANASDPVDLRISNLLQLWTQILKSLSADSDLNAEWLKIREGLLGSARLSKLWRGFGLLIGDFYVFNPHVGHEQLTLPSYESLIEILRSVSSACFSVHLPGQLFKDDSNEFRLGDIALYALDLLPKEVTTRFEAVMPVPNNSYGQYDALKPRISPPAEYKIHLSLKQISILAKSIHFDNSRIGTSELNEEGAIDLEALIDVDIKLSFSALHGLQYIKNEVGVLDMQLKSNAAISDTTHEFIQNLLRPKLSESLQGRVQRELQSLLGKYLPMQTAAPAPVKDTNLSQPQPVKTKRGSSLSRSRRSFLTKLRTDQTMSSDQTSGIAGSPVSGRGGRRLSMKAWLDEASRQDTTLGDAILRPPIHQPSTPMFESVFEDDEVEPTVEYQTMASSLTNISRRDTTTLEGVRLPPIDPASDLETSAHLPSRRRLARQIEILSAEPPALPGTDLVSMADQLHISAQQDTTTEEAIKNPPVHPETHRNRALSLTENPSMKTRMTRLSQSTTVSRDSSPASAVGNRSRRASSFRSGRESFTQLRPGEVRPMSMSLSHVARQDNTLPETQATGALASDPRLHGRPRAESVSSLKDSERIRMRDQLNELSKMDGTLEDNITSPPMYEDVADLYDEESLGGYESDVRRRSVNLRTPRRSFTELKKIKPMSAFLTNISMEDNTRPENQNTGTLASPIESFGVPESKTLTSLPSAEVRPMSRRLSEIAKTDTTLERNIQRPPMADQTYID